MAAYLSIAVRMKEGCPRRIIRVDGCSSDIVGKVQRGKEADVLPGAAYPKTRDALRGEVLEGIQPLMPGVRKMKALFIHIAMRTELNGAPIRLQATCEDIQQSGLAGAVFTAQEDDLAQANFTRDAIKNIFAAEGFLEPLETDKNWWF